MQFQIFAAIGNRAFYDAFPSIVVALKAKYAIMKIKCS